MKYEIRAVIADDKHSFRRILVEMERPPTKIEAKLMILERVGSVRIDVDAIEIVRKDDD